MHESRRTTTGSTAIRRILYAVYIAGAVLYLVGIAVWVVVDLVNGHSLAGKLFGATLSLVGAIIMVGVRVRNRRVRKESIADTIMVGVLFASLPIGLYTSAWFNSDLITGVVAGVIIAPVISVLALTPPNPRPEEFGPKSTTDPEN